MRKHDHNTKLAYYRARKRLSRRQGGRWYFQTREGERGPFDTRAEAALELKRYADTMEFIEENEDSLPSDIDLKDVTVVEMDNSRY